MVNIKIYENHHNNNDDELNEIKNLLYQIINENKTLNERISKYEQYFKKFNKVFLENEKNKLNSSIPKKSEVKIEEVESKNGFEKKEVEKKEVKDKNNDLTPIQKQILTILPVINSDIELEDYCKKIRRGNQQKFTVKTLTEMFKKPRHKIVEALYKNKTSMVNKGLVNYFLLNPSRMKSQKCFYKVGENYKTKKPTTKKSTKPIKTSEKLVNKELFNNQSTITKKLYYELELNDDGTLKHSHKRNNKIYTLPFNIHDIFYIKSLLTPKFTWDEYHSLLSKNKKWNDFNLKKLIYNIQNNKKLNKILEDLNEKINNCEFEKIGEFIKINNISSKITPEQAQNWCNMYINSNKNKEEYIWDLQKRFPELDSMCIRIILYNIDNSDLTQTWSVEKDINDIWIENNPSKRRNLIQNSGGIV